MPDTDKELLTALIIHYQNGYNKLFEAIDSVLKQDYPRIELVVSDDGSADFDVDVVRSYIDSNKGENIERFLVRKEEKNLGTVQHLESVRVLTEGDIELLMAADDRWHDSHVFSDFAGEFNRLGKNAEFITSQIAMYDADLTEVKSLFIDTELIEALQDNDKSSILGAVVKNCVLPGPGSAFRKSFFEKIGNLSSQYTLVEDWPAHIRWLLSGGRVYFLNRITLDHRHGGISHLNAKEYPPYYAVFRNDMVKVFENEIEPNSHLFIKSDYDRALQSHYKRMAQCVSLNNRLSVWVLPSRCPRWKTENTLRNIFLQNCLNFEVIYGAQNAEDVQWFLSMATPFLESMPSLQRIEVLPLYSIIGTLPKFVWHKRFAAASEGVIGYEVTAGKTMRSKQELLNCISWSFFGRSLGDLPEPRIIELDSKRLSTIRNA